MPACRGLFASDANRRDPSPGSFGGFGRDSLQAKKIRFASGFERFPAGLRPSIACWQTSSVFAPASCSRSTPMICSSLNRLPFIVRLLFSRRTLPQNCWAFGGQAIFNVGIC
jgi:hypothetical protein